MNFKEYLDLPQYSIGAKEKRENMVPFLTELHQHHFDRCPEYQLITNAMGVARDQLFEKISDIPFLPVSVFKNHILKGVPEADVYKVLTSSGTTGSVPSRIYLDKETASLQTYALSKIISHVVGNERLPMLIIDSKSVLKDRTSFSARGAGILGLSVFGKDHHYILDDNFEIDEAVLYSFMEKYCGKKMLIFGFTFMVWSYLNLQMKSKLNLSQAILIHSGGWKKLQEMAVDSQTFRKTFKDKFGLEYCYNFYGMVEQVGSVFLENELGYLHCPNFADVIIRNPVDFSVQPHGEEGLIQVVSTLPKSYPGFSILTEDIGVCIGEDNPDIQWKGKYFQILGRAMKAELRGCSDTFAAQKVDT
jgi:phenylacetate-coenzyme A ligase PaaK-like adenylate-forming protein